MKKNIIDNLRNSDNGVPVESRGIVNGRTISSRRVGFSMHKPTGPLQKLVRLLMRLCKTLAMAEAIGAAFFKTPYQIRLEAIKQEILKQENEQKEISCMC
jgi:hypothetical protein